MKLIPLTQGQFAKVDDADFEWLNQWKWYAAKTHNGRQWMACRDFKNKTGSKHISMHRLILGLIDPRIEGEHKDGDSLNNQRCNLRPATKSQNQFNTNRSTRNTSGYKGVSFDRPRGKWKAAIKIDGKSKYLGSYGSPQEAADAYRSFAKAVCGEFYRDQS
jgi:hypothetical protein